jgi:hypothetical protein
MIIDAAVRGSHQRDLLAGLRYSQATLVAASALLRARCSWISILHLKRLSARSCRMNFDGLVAQAQILTLCQI